MDRQKDDKWINTEIDGWKIYWQMDREQEMGSEMTREWADGWGWGDSRHLHPPKSHICSGNQE